MSWLWLFLAIALDVAATVCQKLSNGFTRPIFTVLLVVFYGGSLLPMSLALRRLEVATAYAIWSALGTALVTMIGMVVFKEAATPLKCGAIVLIVAGVVCLNVASGQAERAARQTTAEASKSSPVLPFAEAGNGSPVATTTKTDEAAPMLVRVAGERK
jgi:small multidrug resistance pump